ncbi:MAG: hypothetical protein AAF849_22310, partial [Bacteroidota bacterium]
MFSKKIISILLIIILTINLTACYGNYFPTVATAATFPIDLTFGELSDFIQFGDPIHSQLRNQYSELNDKYENLKKQFELTQKEKKELLSQNSKLKKENDNLNQKLEFIQNEEKQILSQYQELKKEYDNLNKQPEFTPNKEKEPFSQQTKNLFAIAELYNTIKGYEFFLANSAGLTSLENKAVSHIYDLTEKADLIEGYRYLLNKFPDSSDVNKVIYRLYEIAYQVAEKDNSISSYNGFISNFEAAPMNLRKKALDQTVSLSCQSLNSEYEEQIKSIPDNELFSQFLIEKIGRGIYQEALNVENSNKSLFLQKYYTILECNLFANSNTRFTLLRDSELTKLRTDIENQLNALGEDINQSKSLILQKISEAETSQELENNYIQEIRNIIQQQNQVLENSHKPSSWNDEENPWENYMRIGIYALD